MQMDGKPEREDIPEETFLKARTKAELTYKAVPEVYCPYLKGPVHFNAKGLDHIKFKEWNKPRSRFDQFLRLKLLYLAPEILKKSHTLQGVWHRKEWERRKRRDGWEKILIEVSYYEFVAVIGRVRLKVIVKEAKGGARHFWTLIPFWRMNTVTKERLLHEPDTEREVGDGREE